MKKRFLSTLMALCLALSLLPATALAVEEGDASGAAGGEPTGSEIQATRAIEETDVAAIGDQGYATLSAAMSAAKDGETVRLLKETSEASQIYIYGEKITLDLNGYTLTTTATKNFLNLYNTNGKLTITDESESGGGKIVSPSGDFIFNIVSGALEIQKVTVQANGFWTYNGSKYGNTIVCLTGAAASNPGATNHATFTLGSDAKLLCADTSDGESIGPGYSVMVDYNGTASYGVVVDIYGTTEHAGLYVNGTIKETSGNVPSFTLHDGAYIDGGIYAAGYAKWDIDGATVIGETGIEIRAGELTVEEGSVITGTATPTRVEPNGNGSTTLGAGIAVAQHTTKLPISVTINGGDISGFTALYQSNPQDNGEEDVAKVQMDVKGGDYTAINGGRNSVYSENKTGFITGGSFSNDVSQYVPNSGEGGGMSVTDDGDGNFTVSVSKDAVAEVNSVGYTTLQAAINAANDGDTVTLLKEVTITDTITIDKDITVTAVEGATVTAKTDGHSFVLSNGATLDGLTVNLADSYSVNIVQMGDNSTVKNCKFTGGYDLETDGTSGETSRAIEGSSGELTITGNTFENLRQPAYINACTGEISNNYVSGTRGWVICGNSNMEITGNTFGTNAVDIAIIDDNAGDSTNTNNYAEKIAELSESNNGAYTQNQLSMVEAEDGALVVGKSDGYTLDKALAAAQEGDTVRLLDNVDVTAPISLPEGVTLDGGNHAINYTGKKKTDNPSVLVLAGQGADGVTVQNVTLNTNGNLKHGVEFFAADSGKLSNVTVNGGSYTAVQNNGSTGLVIEDCVLNPDEGAYTNIEYALSDSAQTADGTTPSMTIDNVTFDSSTRQIWADNATLNNVKEEMGESATDDGAVEKINDSIENLNSGSVTVEIGMSTDNTQTSTSTVPSTKPVEPDDDDDRPSSGGSSSSEPSYSPVMDVSKGGSVKVNPRTPGEGDEVTITVDPDRGYEVGDVTVTDRNGRDVRVTAERDGTYTFEQPKGRVTIAVTFVREGTSTFFTDVAETYWAYDEIAWAYENGYVNGVTATTFAPGASISRQQIWMILARIAGDDPADMAAARQWSIDNGISDGTNPGSAVTRQQLAALLYRYAQMMGYANEARVDLSSFPDAGSVASYAVEPMQWSVANSIVGGTTDGTLNPTGTATRAQFAVMLYRFWTGV